MPCPALFAYRSDPVNRPTAVGLASPPSVTSTTRRTLTAVTAGALAALGVALGTGAAFTILTLGYLDGVARMPIADLLVIGIATPSVAALGGWLLAGREPPAVSRQAIA